MSMDLDEALAVVLCLKDRPQTNMTAELREIQARAWAVVSRGANNRINFDLATRNKAQGNEG